MHGYAYVTLVSTTDYLPGATALIRSLRGSGSRYPLVVLLLDGIVGRRAAAVLEDEGAIVHLIQPIHFSAGFERRHARARIHQQDPYTNGDKPRFHSPLLNFHKLRLWELEQYERVVFIDADAVALRNPDEIFGFEPFAATANWYIRNDPRRMNSGVFVAAPSRALFGEMLVRLEASGAYWRRTDQTFLESLFPAWDRLPQRFNALQYRWLNVPDSWDWDDVVILHFQYDKPWDAGSSRHHQLAPLMNVWRHVFDHGTAPVALPIPRAHQPREPG